MEKENYLSDLDTFSKKKKKQIAMLIWNDMDLYKKKLELYTDFG